MRQHLAKLTTAILAVVGLVATPQHAQSCHRSYCSVSYSYCSVCYYPMPACVPCYVPPAPCYPHYPGRIVAASATILVHVPADAKLFVDGKLLEGTGSLRVVTTGTIPIGQTLVVTLRVGDTEDDDEDGDEEGPPEDPDDPGPKPPPGEEDGAVTKKVTVRAFDCIQIKFTE